VKWLGEIEDSDVKEPLKPYPADEMKMWPISQRLNSPKNALKVLRLRVQDEAGTRCGGTARVGVYKPDPRAYQS
jgi:hypothetical protein